MAILGSLLTHTKSLFVTPAGLLILFGSICSFSPTPTVILSLTTTVIWSIILPSFVLTMIVTIPGVTPVTTPFLSTVAIFGLPLSQTKSLFVTPDGLVILFGSIGFVPPTSTIVLSLTITVTWEVTVPSFVLTITVVVPGLIPLTTPFSSTVAILGLLLIHFKSPFVAFSGSIVASICCTNPTSKNNGFGLKFIFLVFISSFTTVTFIVATFPFGLVTVIIATPSFNPFIFPLESTLTILGSLLFHVSFVEASEAGLTLTINFIVSPILMLTLFRAKLRLIISSSIGESLIIEIILLIGWLTTLFS